MECEIYKNQREIAIAMNGGSHLSISCLVCGEPVALNEQEEIAMAYGHHIHSKICDKCKAAILYVREQMI